jgi:tetratricopeptide (TPR) repeat protein
LTVARGRTWSTDVRLWEATVQQVGSKARAWFNLGGAYLAAGDPRARDAFLRVLDLEPGRPEVFYNLGLIDQREGSLVTALSWYEQALGMDADYWPALVNSGNVRHALGDPVGAIAAYLDTLAVNPDYWPAQYNLAVVYADTDRPDLAEARLRTVLDWEPEFRDARALLAVSLSQLGRDAEAEREWTVLGIEPVDPGRTADVPAPLGAED